MTAESSDAIRNSTEYGPPGATSRLIVWLTIQLVALLLAAARVPLAARYVEPAEQLALHVLLMSEIATCSLLFPWLLRDARITIQVIATTLPFQVAAAYLAGLSLREIGPAVALADGWMVVLAVWSPLLRSSRAHSLGIACASGLTLGGGILRYLRLEFAADGMPAGWESVTPLPSTALALDGKPLAGGWGLLIALSLGGIAIQIILRARRTMRIARAA